MSKIEIEVEGLDPVKMEEGVLVAVEDADGEPRFLNDDPSKPMQMRVCSQRSTRGKAASLKVQKQTTTLNKGRRPGNEISIPNDKFLQIMAAGCISQLINFSSKAAIQTPTPEELESFFSDPTMEPLRDLAYDTARNDSKYLPDKKAPVGNVAAAPAGEPKSTENPASES